MSKYPFMRQSLLRNGFTEAHFFEPEQMSTDVILETHDPVYWNKLLSNSLSRQEERRIGFPWSDRLLDREIHIMYGTVQAALSALEHGVAFNIAGGTHHAYRDRGEGFCIFNDIAIGANYLLKHTRVEKVLVVDLDVHQGNGTAAIFQDNPNVFTFSMHGEKNYPFKKEQSDLDIGLPNGIQDAEYLSLLREHFDAVMNWFHPDFIFYQSGVDILETDKLGKLGVSLSGCEERDRIVLSKAADLGIPLTAVMGGGYSPDINTIVEAHVNTYLLEIGRAHV